MKALVTGAAGFIGRHLVHDLLERGFEVVAFDLHAAAEGRLAAARWIEGDIGDADLVRDAVAGCDRVYHLAAAHLDQKTPAAEYRRVNVDAAVRLLEAAHAAGVSRFLHCSSVGVYGHVPHPPAREDAPKSPGNTYERTKLEGEDAVLAKARDLGASVVVARPAWVYGAGCPRTARLLDMVRRGRFFYFGSGNHLRHPIYIDDCIAGLHRVIEAGEPGAVYNLAGERPMPLSEMVSAAAKATGTQPPSLRVPMWIGTCAALAAELLCAPLGKRPPISRRSLVFFRNTNAYSIDAARAIGFEPVVPIDEGFKRCVHPAEVAAPI